MTRVSWAVVAACGLLGWWLGVTMRRRQTRPDPHLPQGAQFRYTTPRTYDEQKAVAGARRAQAHSPTGRRYVRPVPAADKVAPFRRVER